MERKNKNLAVRYSTVRFLAAGEGFEPSHTESESAVLPLHKPAIWILLVRSLATNVFYYTENKGNVKLNFQRF